MKKKILFVFPQWHFNIVDTLKGLSRKYDVHTLSFWEGEEINQLWKIGLPKVRMHNLGLLKKVRIVSSDFFFPNPSDLWKKLSRKYDLVVFKNLYDPLSLLGFLYCRIKGVPFIFSEQKIKKPGGLIGRIVSLIDAYLNVWINIKRVKGFSPTKVGFAQLKKITKFPYYIPFAVDISKYRQKKFKKSKVVKVLNISKFQRRKDQLLLMDALENLAQKGVKLNLTLVGGVAKGSDYLSLIKSKAKQVSYKVYIKQKVPRNNISKVFLASDLFVLSSFDEPAAYSHLEAMAYGLPVICSDENGTRNYIKKGVNGEVFTAHSVNSLQNCLEKVLLSKSKVDWKKIEKMGKKGRELAEKNHSVERITKLFSHMVGDWDE